MSNARTSKAEDLADELRKFNDPAFHQSIVEQFRPIANPHRLAILKRLVGCCPPGSACRGDARRLPCVGDLGRDLGIVPSTVSHHLKELRAAGLVRMERRGQTIECSLDAEALRELAEFFSALAAGGPRARRKKE